MPLSYRNDPVQTEIHSGTQPFSIVTIALDRDSGKLLKLWLPSSLLHEIPDYPGNGSFLDWSGGSGARDCPVLFRKRRPQRVRNRRPPTHAKANKTRLALPLPGPPDVPAHATPRRATG